MWLWSVNTLTISMLIITHRCPTSATKNLSADTVSESKCIASVSKSIQGSSVLLIQWWFDGALTQIGYQSWSNLTMFIIIVLLCSKFRFILIEIFWFYFTSGFHYKITYQHLWWLFIKSQWCWFYVNLYWHELNANNWVHPSQNTFGYWYILI